MALRTLAARLPLASVARQRCARGVSGIKIVEDHGKAQENLLFAAEDERLLKKMIENSPELNPALQGVASMLDDGTSTADKVKMVFMKHGIPPVNKKLIGDLVELIEK
eukprot:TRINITY_DN48810_c0_g1_i1.p1 TRINITY_DN48810_c0_g1~~TRINITY_DN48810_c0_g1_i1.p1  ORF type:complete len:108 (-),score=32.32 TRINITY_DN48810_c0_g1_i1:112-435(-)